LSGEGRRKKGSGHVLDGEEKRQSPPFLISRSENGKVKNGTRKSSCGFHSAREKTGGARKISSNPLFAKKKMPPCTISLFITFRRESGGKSHRRKPLVGGGEKNPLLR